MSRRTAGSRSLDPTTRLSEQLLERKTEPRQYIAAVEDLPLPESSALVKRGIDCHRFGLGINVPNETHAGLEVFTQLAIHFFCGIILAQDLNDQVRHKVRDRAT